VNGPGEAADADVALCAAKTKTHIYRKGRRVSTVPQDKAIQELLKQLQEI
jgi:(E)-4-hydroxy-3-methylbut-2-enyl-diphosphate synthase